MMAVISGKGMDGEKQTGFVENGLSTEIHEKELAEHDVMWYEGGGRVVAICVTRRMEE